MLGVSEHLKRIGGFGNKKLLAIIGTTLSKLSMNCRNGKIFEIRIITENTRTGFHPHLREDTYHQS
jgi:hypothetical protein